MRLFESSIVQHVSVREILRRITEISQITTGRVGRQLPAFAGLRATGFAEPGGVRTPATVSDRRTSTVLFLTSLDFSSAECIFLDLFG